MFLLLIRYPNKSNWTIVGEFEGMAEVAKNLAPYARICEAKVLLLESSN